MVVKMWSGWGKEMFALGDVKRNHWGLNNLWQGVPIVKL